MQQVSSESLRLLAPTGDTPASDPAPKNPPVDTPTIGKRLIRLSEVFKAIGVSKATGHRLIGAGKIGPKPIRFTSACVRFDVDEVSCWLETRTPDGNLHDAKSWPAAWAMIQRKRN
jgi:predicted DNA-binding transcriptional regulator AlpA